MISFSFKEHFCLKNCWLDSNSMTIFFLCFLWIKQYFLKSFVDENTFFYELIHWQKWHYSELIFFFQSSKLSLIFKYFVRFISNNSRFIFRVFHFISFFFFFIWILFLALLWFFLFLFHYKIFQHHLVYLALYLNDFDFIFFSLNTTCQLIIEFVQFNFKNI